MKCPEGLIYDKNLRSCAIPSDDWECLTDSGEYQTDENNVYGIDNLDVSQEQPESDGSNEYLEVIGENLSPARGRESDSFDLTLEEGSGEDELPTTVTQPAPTVRMLVTTQLQRLTQLMQSIQDKADGVFDDADITAHDLNSFLATQKIQSDSADYQKTDFQSNDKTPIPSNGRIHPEIMSNILNRQISLNSKLTTPAMDATTPKIPRFEPTYYVNKDPITEIQLKSGLSLDGTPGSHQIVVNRPEGSVLFNVPSQHASDQNHHSPYLSEDILKTILEISKQMVTQNQKQNPQVSYAPQPIYYGVPIPMLSPQSNVHTFYNHDYRNNLTQEEKPVINTKTRPSNIQIISKPSTVLGEKSETVANGYYDQLGSFYHPPKAQSVYTPQSSMKDYLQPYNYYQSYPNYQNGYQSVQNPQAPYQAPQSYSNYQYGLKNRFDNPLHYNQPQYNFDIPHYGNRPLVPDSSAPFYVDQQSLQQKPYVKESYLSSSYDDAGDEEELYDEVDTIGSTEKPADELICSVNVQRQANKTDCMRYYVCNAKTKEVLSYTCPMFTAFNDQTKYCDSQLFSSCKKIKDREISMSQNKRIYAETNKALEAVKKESQKVERIASMVRKESQKIYTRRNQYESVDNSYATRYENDNQYPSRYDQSQQYEEIPQAPFYPTKTEPPKLKIKQPLRRPQFAVTSAPVIKEIKKPKQSSKRKRKKVKCYDTGNIVDPESSNSYWHCFKGTDGRMKRINKKCTSNFVFCPESRYCSPVASC